MLDRSYNLNPLALCVTMAWNKMGKNAAINREFVLYFIVQARLAGA